MINSEVIHIPTSTNLLDRIKNYIDLQTSRSTGLQIPDRRTVRENFESAARQLAMALPATVEVKADDFKNGKFPITLLDPRFRQIIKTLTNNPDLLRGLEKAVSAKKRGGTVSKSEYYRCINEGKHPAFEFLSSSENLKLLGCDKDLLKLFLFTLVSDVQIKQETPEDRSLRCSDLTQSLGTNYDAMEKVTETLAI